MITVTGTTPGLQLPAVQQKEDNPSPVSISSTFLLFSLLLTLSSPRTSLPACLPTEASSAVPCVCSYRNLICCSQPMFLQCRNLICCSLCVFLQKPYLLFPVCVPTETSSAVPCMCSAETSSAVPCMCSAETSSAVPCVCSYRNLICCSLCVCSAETSSAVSALCRRGREGEQVGWSEVGGGVLWDSG